MKKIYILSDDDDFLHIIQLILRKKYNLKSNKNIACIRKDLDEFMPDLILIDHFSEIKDSQETISRIILSNAVKSVPFIIFSGSIETENFGNNLGAVRFIPKPSTSREISDYVDSFFAILPGNDQVII